MQLPQKRSMQALKYKEKLVIHNDVKFGEECHKYDRDSID